MMNWTPRERRDGTWTVEHAGGQPAPLPLPPLGEADAVLLATRLNRAGADHEALQAALAGEPLTPTGVFHAIDLAELEREN
ncbi:hypothetical protein ACXR2T_10210 [Leucobacter sp. HY1910]